MIEPYRSILQALDDNGMFNGGNAVHVLVLRISVACHMTVEICELLISTNVA